MLDAARAAAETAARQILERLQDGTEQIHCDAWKYPFEIARALRGVVGVSVRTDPRRLLDAVMAAHGLLAGQLELEEHDFAAAGNFFDTVAAVWPAVRYGIGEGPLELAFKRAQKDGTPVTGATTDGYRRFVNLCRCLQELVGGEPIFLPGRRIGALWGVSRTMVHNWITLAVTDGHLVLVDGTHGPHRARRFRFVVVGSRS
jgi:hypothetical protein